MSAIYAIKSRCDTYIRRRTVKRYFKNATKFAIPCHRILKELKKKENRTRSNPSIIFHCNRLTGFSFPVQIIILTIPIFYLQKKNWTRILFTYSASTSPTHRFEFHKTCRAKHKNGLLFPFTFHHSFTNFITVMMALHVDFSVCIPHKIQCLDIMQDKNIK